MRLLAAIISILCLSAGAAMSGPLHDAAAAGDITVVQKLLDGGADVNEADDVGTPLVWAMFTRKGVVARLLLDHGANPNVDGPGWTPLVSAIKMGDTELAEAMLAAGADVNAGKQLKPLAAAAEEGNVAIARRLLEHSVDPDGRVDDEGRTALHVAAEAGSRAVAELLITSGADVNALSTIGHPPLHYAVFGDHSAIAELLRASGARPGPIEPITPYLANADPIRGAKAGALCLSCHRSDEGTEGGYVGPHFWDIVGRPVASLPNYPYSAAIKAAGEVWDYETLNRFMARPSEVAPGTRMISSGIPDPRDRADFTAYLRALSDNPVPLPWRQTAAKNQPTGRKLCPQSPSISSAGSAAILYVEL